MSGSARSSIGVEWPRGGSIFVGAFAGSLIGAMVAAPLPGGSGRLSAQPSSHPVAQVGWPVRTLPHVDLWLHAFAMLSVDTGSVVPLFRRGYRDSVQVVKNGRNVLTALDGNRESLTRGLQRGNNYLPAQFLAFDYASLADLRASIDRFLAFDGDARRASDAATARRMAPWAAIFRTPADREWLRLFNASVQDEALRFFDSEYQRIFRARQAVVSAVDSLWQQQYRARFERFLNNSGQRQGDLLLSLPLGGEGRTGPGPTQRTIVAVPFPERAEDAVEALYVFAHEVTGTIVGPVVADNVTPAEQRAGLADRAVASAQVIGGAMLLGRVAPELLRGYQRYYLAQIGADGSAGVGAGGSATHRSPNHSQATSTADDAALSTAFERAFPLSSVMRDALRRQIDIVLGGI